MSLKSHHNWDYIPISQQNLFEDSPDSHISVYQPYIIVKGKIDIWQQMNSKNFKCNLASHINKIDILLLNQVQETLFRTQNFTLSNNGSLSSTSWFLSPSKCLRVVLKKFKESSHMVNHSDLFLSQMSCMNTLSQTFIFFSLCHTAIQMKLSQCNISILALGQKTSVFCAELELPVPLSCIPFLYNSGSLLFCFTDVSSCD